MIIPSIDLRGGRVVQLVGGDKQAVDAGSAEPWLDRFGIAGEIAVVDLDGALGQGNQSKLIHELCSRGRCRVGGGIRSYESARDWLDAGATKIVIGTAAQPSLLRRLPKERVVVALDARDGEVVVEGWSKGTGADVVERMRTLREYVGGFLVTFVELEGRMSGTNLEQARVLAEEAGDARLTIAGGITTANEIAELDRIGADAQVGMALYTGRLSLADAIAAPLTSDRTDGLFATVVCNERGTALGLAWSSIESLRLAIEERRGVYHSRSRGIWRKGSSSGATQELLGVSLDCDRDALRFTVRQDGSGFCHRRTATCWGPLGPFEQLQETISERLHDAPAGSYTARLNKEEGLLAAKLVEEAAELASATERESIMEEFADLVYFASVALNRAGGSLADVDRVLARRSLKLSRRAGNRKPAPDREGAEP